MRRSMMMSGALASLVASQGIAAGVKTLEPTSAWRMDYSNERCSLAQQYGSGADAVLLQIDSYGALDHFRATLAGPGVPRGSGTSAVGAYRLPGDTGGREAKILRGTTAEGEAAVTFNARFIPYEEYRHLRQLNGEERERESRRDAANPPYEHTITAIGLGAGGGSAIQLNVHDMAAPLNAMRTCVDSLRKAWGLDPAVQKALSRPAEPNPLDLQRLNRDYPAVMRKQGLSAYTPVRLMVDVDGSATACVMQNPGVDEALKATFCNSLRRFQPALDAAGKPVPSVYASDVDSLVGE